MVIEGNMAFGEIQIGTSFTADLRIINTGTDTLNVTGMTLPSALTSVYASNWRSGNIAPGASQIATIRFTPTSPQDYNGTLTITANQTGGPNSINVSGRGVYPPRPLFTRSGSGNTVFDMPPGVTRLLIRGRWNGSGTSNFIVSVGGRTAVNEILRQTITYEGIHAVSGTTVEITQSSAITWSFEEIP
jgi:hypothetical protein